jgi:uncharacterized protein (DUF2141 family)
MRRKGGWNGIRWKIGACLVLGYMLPFPVEAAAGQDLPSTAPASGTLVVTLSGMQDDRGSLVYAMWAGPEGWLETNSVQEGAAPIVQGSTTIRFENLPYGEYAISAYHDRNGNGKLDTGLFRIPKEPLGTSNDAKIRFGPPRYEDAAFILDQSELAIEIPVRKLF